MLVLEVVVVVSDPAKSLFILQLPDTSSPLTRNNSEAFCHTTFIQPIYYNSNKVKLLSCPSRLIVSLNRKVIPFLSVKTH